MGLVGVQENGNVTENGLSEISLGSQNKYRRMDSIVADDEEDEASLIRRANAKKYVIVCAVFASLNSVLLGYGGAVMAFGPSFKVLMIGKLEWA